MKTLLTIAGFDPSSGAGITADLMVFAAHGLFGTACITGLTVQSTIGVRSTHPIEPAIVRETLEFLNADLPPAGIKIGMLATAANVIQVSEYLERICDSESWSRDQITVVLDPVFESSSGRELLDPEGVEVLRQRLVPLVDWITPNIPELEVLSGKPVRTPEDVPGACRNVQNLVGDGQLGIIAKGGHLDPPDDFVLSANGQELWLAGKRIETTSTHGTGCAFSSAFLSGLVLGQAPAQAASRAKEYVAGALRFAPRLGTGTGPMNHLWQFIKSEISR